MVFRIRYELRGGHVHCRFFAGKHKGALGKCGDLVMRDVEFTKFRTSAKFIQFLPEVE